MKKLILLLAIIGLISCKNEPKDYVSLQGEITNSSAGILTVLGKNFKKEITINEDGSFKDTLKVTEGFHRFSDGAQQSFLYLKNGYDFNIDYDTQEFPKSLSFNGDGSGTNNYLISKLQFIKDEQLDNPKLIFELEKAEFDSKIGDLEAKLEELLANSNDLEPNVLKMEKDANSKMFEYYNANYEKEHSSSIALKKGTPSPKFNYPDINGENVSLDDLKGKYVYIDVWATWCGPCKREIPFLKELNEEFKNSNLAIVSLSIDKQENKDKWLKMVKDENLKGVQIMADKDWTSDFVTAYNIRGIPRFILIDPEGNIYDANAPRPSNPNLKELLKGLDI